MKNINALVSFMRWFSFLLLMGLLICNAQTSNLLGFDTSGKLTYVSDAKGNTIPDFSYVGYHHSEKEIPDVSVVKTITPITGDNWDHIQSAIHEVEAMSPDSNGHRGALLLSSGTYQVSQILNITKSGVVIRGEGDATVLVATTTNNRSDFIVFQGTSSATAITSTKKKIIDSYVPIGTRTVTVASGHTFGIGDRILLERAPNQAWIDLLGTGNLSDTDPSDTNWTPASYAIRSMRKVTFVNGDAITFDAPVVDPIDPQYAEGFLYQYSWNGRIEEVGIENIRLESEYASNNDENHGWNAVRFNNTENAWARNVNSYYFGYSCVNVGKTSSKISVLNCKMIDPKSQTSGGRKYSFNCDGQQVLFKDCLARGGRHDFVSGSRVPGPNAFVNCTSENQLSTTGPHHRWATGQLYDNVVGTKDFAAENRRNSGSGHGWAGAQILFWNCSTTTKFVLQDPPGDHVNWAIGCTGTITKNGSFGANDPLGYVESQNTPLEPFSLFEKQLADRLQTLSVPDYPEQNLERDISLYPNPTDGILYITSKANLSDWSLYSMFGKMVRKGNTNKMDLGNLESGIYILRLGPDINEIVIKK